MIVMRMTAFHLNLKPMNFPDVVYGCRLSLNRRISLRGWLVHIAVILCVYTLYVRELKFDTASALIFFPLFFFRIRYSSCHCL